MSKTILYIASSVDGIIARKNDDVSWLLPYQNINYGFQDFIDTVGVVIGGWRAYEAGIKEGWGWPYKGVPGIIMTTHSPKEKPEGAELEFVKGNVIEIWELGKKKIPHNKNIFIAGGAHIAQEFLNAKLIDEIDLYVVPLILHDGIRLFQNLSTEISLQLLTSKAYDNGLVRLHYKVQK